MITILTCLLVVAAAAAFYAWRQAINQRERADIIGRQIIKASEEINGWEELHKKTKSLYENAEAAHAAHVAEIKRVRALVWTKPAKRLPAEAVKRAFVLEPESPLWIALHQEIDDYLQDVLDQATQPPSATLTAEARTHLAGGAEHIRLLQKRLLEVHDAARTLDTDLEAAE